MKNYFIIHGAYGNNKENWFGWLEEILQSKGNDVYNFNYPTPDGQNFENWSNVLNKVKDKINDESVFVCHSISCAFLAKYCIVNKIKIGKAIFVSGFNNYYFIEDFDKINKHMYMETLEGFEKQCKERICIYSKTDPYVKLVALQAFAKEIKAKEIVYDDAGHFNASAGYTTFEDLLKFL